MVLPGIVKDGFMVIKGVAFESGKKPVVCIPVMGKDKETVLREAARVVAAGAVMIEWRIDYLSDFSNMSDIQYLMRELSKLCRDTVFLATLRTKDQGGLAEMQEPQLSRYYRDLASMKKADFIDVEFFGVQKPERLLKDMKSEGAKVITSHHDFLETPDERVMYMLLEKMADGQADLVKLAVMPKSLQDVLDILRVTCRFAEEYPEIPVASMSMGSMGIISRVCGEVFGSCMTFGTMGASSAPGQMEEKELSQMLDLIHKNFER